MYLLNLQYNVLLTRIPSVTAEPLVLTELLQNVSYQQSAHRSLFLISSCWFLYCLLCFTVAVSCTAAGTLSKDP